jgi:hypothetical protein
VNDTRHAPLPNHSHATAPAPTSTPNSTPNSASDTTPSAAPAELVAHRHPTTSRHPLSHLFEADTVRLRCAQVLQAISNNLSAHFRLDAAALEQLAAQVADQAGAAAARHAAEHACTSAAAQGVQVTTKPAPSPRAEAEPLAQAAAAAALWQHLKAGGVDRLAELDGLLADQPADERSRAWVDLAFLGVLLSADPGPHWRCTEQAAVPAAVSARADAEDLLALLDQAGKTARAATPAVAAAQAAAETAAQHAAEHAAEAAAEQTAPSASAAPPVDPHPARPAARALAPPASTCGGAEGLAIATYRAFVAGAFSASRHQPCRADAATLRHMDVAAVRALFQGTPQNLLPGLEGRAAVLSRLGQLLQTLPQGAQARPFDLLPMLAATATTALPAPETPLLQAPVLLRELLHQAASIWPAPRAQSLPAGDAWQHAWAGAAVGRAEPGEAPAGSPVSEHHTQTVPLQDPATSGWVPLHAMAQTLVAALALPVAKAGGQLQGLHRLTASADHATSALLLQAGVLLPRHPGLLQETWKVSDEAVVECRAATVALLCELAEHVQRELDARHAPGGHAPTLTAAQVAQATAAVVATRPGPVHQGLRIESDGALL